jgi:hypothetical protein
VIGDGDIAAAMVILSSGLRAKVFFFVVEFEELVVVVPPERQPRRAVRGLGVQSPQRRGFEFFSSGAFPLRLRGALVFSSGKLLSASAPSRARRLHDDLFGSGRGTSTLNLQIELLLVAQRRCRGCAIPKGCPAWLH